MRDAYGAGQVSGGGVRPALGGRAQVRRAVVVAVEEHENRRAVRLGSRQRDGPCQAFFRGELASRSADRPADIYAGSPRFGQQPSKQLRHRGDFAVAFNDGLDSHGRSAGASAFDRSSSPAPNSCSAIARFTEGAIASIRVMPSSQLTKRK